MKVNELNSREGFEEKYEWPKSSGCVRFIVYERLAGVERDGLPASNHSS